MVKRVPAIVDGRLLRPLEQLDLEARIRLDLAIALIDEEFQREFGLRRKPGVHAGPEPWDGFLDLSLI